MLCFQVFGSLYSFETAYFVFLRTVELVAEPQRNLQSLHTQNGGSSTLKELSAPHIAVILGVEVVSP